MEPERGTPQGSGLSPLLGNLYLHYTLDVWFEREVKPRLGGEAVLCATAMTIGGARTRSGCRRCWASMERFGLKLHPEKTRLTFERPEAGQRGGKGPGTFEFLGFCTGDGPVADAGRCGVRGARA